MIQYLYLIWILDIISESSHYHGFGMNFNWINYSEFVFESVLKQQLSRNSKAHTPIIESQFLISSKLIRILNQLRLTNDPDIAGMTPESFQVMNQFRIWLYYTRNNLFCTARQQLLKDEEEEKKRKPPKKVKLIQNWFTKMALYHMSSLV